MILAYDPASNPLNSNEWAFPLAECVHIAAFTMSIGLIAIVDLRLLGLGLRGQSPVQLAKSLALWILAGMIIVITSGLVIFSSDPLAYMRNPAFRFKVECLAVALIYNYTIHRKITSSEHSVMLNKLVAGISLLLWVGVVFGGLYIAFVP